jgi:hypothetical protein
VNQDALFLKTLDDLRARVTPGCDEYEVLGIAALVRKLLLDDLPLVHSVNRDRRLRLRYAIDASPPIWKLLGEEPPSIWSVQDGLDPATSLGGSSSSKDVSLDEFLGTMVMYVRHQEITVKDVVLHTAVVVGAVHRGEPRSDPQRTLSQLAEELSVGGYQPDIRALQAIGRVVLRALAPLRERIEAERL